MIEKCSSLLLLPLPATAAEFSAEERQLVADIRRMMDKTTDLLIYAYTNETKMNLAEMKRVYKEFDQIADWFTEKIPYERYERRTGSFCHGAANFAWDYWKDTTDYKEFNGTETQKIIGMPRNYQELKDRQKESLEGHFNVFDQCAVHLDQVPTAREDREKARSLTLHDINKIRKSSTDLFRKIRSQTKPYDERKMKEFMRDSDEIYKNYHSIYNFIYNKNLGGLSCLVYVDLPKYFISHFLLAYGSPESSKRLPDGLFNIGYNKLVNTYDEETKFCDMQIEKYRKDNPQ
ncbi:hypothetical protein [Elstera cyanobacteriorum]|uniref:hypothetical protein n=1 Tax=Elstera cyanobacteriorum TaxID=2022747 RepID=UPI002356406D|nr:hypothetical protein [Elstera cyanobacteriorum]MCK6444556.1 hypothetical protein [Elstera cyanobacteriorum]